MSRNDLCGTAVLGFPTNGVIDMASFKIPLNQSGDPISLFTIKLHQRCLNITLNGDTTYPNRALSSGMSKFAQRLDLFTKELERSDLYSTNEEGSSSPVLLAFQDLCYAATELFDVYAQAIPVTLGFRRQRRHKNAIDQYNEIVKSRRSDWALICNKIKHNYNTLVPVKQVSQRNRATVRGFALYRPTETDAVVINKQLHRNGERSRPFDLAAQQLLHDIWRCDFAASNVLAVLSDTSEEEIDSIQVTMHVGNLLKRLASRRVYAGEDQPTMYDGFHIEADQLLFTRCQATRLHPPLEISAIYRADGLTKTFETI